MAYKLNQVVFVRLTVKEQNRVRQMAKADKRSMSNLIRWLIEKECSLRGHKK